MCYGDSMLLPPQSTGYPERHYGKEQGRNDAGESRWVTGDPEIGFPAEEGTNGDHRLSVALCLTIRFDI